MTHTASGRETQKVRAGGEVANEAAADEGAAREVETTDLNESLLRLTLTLGITEVASLVAHELSQPLGAMQLHATACARWLTQSPPSLEEARAAAERTLRDGDRVRKSMQSLRALMPVCEPEMSPIDLNEQVRNAVRFLREAGKAQAVEIRLDLNDLPQVVGDPLQITHVLLNLLTNAVEALSDSTLPHVIVVASRHDPAEGAVIMIRDTGVGIDPEDASGLFTPLFTTKPGGLGLGLATSRRVIDVHGGRIWAESNADVGATFCFSLPAAPGNGS